MSVSVTDLDRPLYIGLSVSFHSSCVLHNMGGHLNPPINIFIQMISLFRVRILQFKARGYMANFTQTLMSFKRLFMVLLGCGAQQESNIVVLYCGIILFRDKIFPRISVKLRIKEFKNLIQTQIFKAYAGYPNISLDRDECVKYKIAYFPTYKSDIPLNMS